MEELKTKKFGWLAAAVPFDPGSVTLIFIHGAGGSARMWKAQIDAFAERVNAGAIDLPGHGRSDGPSCHTIADYARAVIEFIDAIEAPRPLPVGLSMGGAITLQLLLEYPERFTAGILISTGARLKVMPAIFQAIESNYSGYLQMMAKVAASPKTPPERLAEYLQEAARCPAAVVKDDFRACDAFDVMEKIPAIEAPVLVITAEDDQLTPPKYGEFLAAKIGGAKRVQVAEAGHLVPVEKPEEVNRAILAFLDENGL